MGKVVEGADLPKASPNALTNVEFLETNSAGVSGIDRSYTEKQLREKLIASCPTAEIVLGDVTTQCILDSGAETSLITSSFYKEHLANRVGSLRPVGKFIRLMGANDLDIPIKGYLEIPITIFGLTISACFLVRDDSSEASNERRRIYPVLLGCNVLRTLSKMRATPCGPSKDEWVVAMQWLTCLGEEQDGGNSTGRPVLPTRGFVGCVCVARDETVAPFSASVLSCVLSQPLQTESCGACVLVQPISFEASSDDTSGGLKKPMIGNIHIVEGVQSIEGSSLQVLVCNFGETPVTLPAKSKIATALEARLNNEVHLWEIEEGLQVSVEQVVVDQNSGVSEGAANNVEGETIGMRVPSSPVASRETIVFPDGFSYLLPPGISLKEFDRREALLIAELIRKYEKAFSMGPLDIGECTLIPHEIKLTSDQPIRQPYRRIPPQHMREVQKLLQDLLDKGVIQRSGSPYASPTVLVRKKDGSIRLCIDYRKLNAITLRDAFPLPRIEETLEALGGSRYFTSLDMAHGYFQLIMHPDSVDKTAFRVPWGLFSFTRMPQGLCNSPSTFQRTVELIFGDLNMSKLILYLDDILVYSATFQEHLERLGVVFERLIENGLKLKGSKCHFFRSEVKHLGHVVGNCGVKVDPDKVEQIENWPTPRNGEEVRSFLGLASFYRRFISGFSKIAAPLHALVAMAGSKTGKNPEFKWSTEAEDAFRQLKRALCTTPVLAYPDFDRDFVVEVDASLRGLGACLLQAGSDGALHPIAYASRGLRGAEKNYSDFSSFKLELLALKWAIAEKFRDYLVGSKFVVYTDNNPLAHLQNAKLGATEQRWVAQLAPFNMEVKFRPGKVNRCADALSRRPLEVIEVAEVVGDCANIPCEIRSATGKGCTKVFDVSKETVPKQSTVLPSFTSCELATMQKEDEQLGEVWRHWLNKWESAQQGEELNVPGVKGWLRERNLIVEKNGVLYRKTKDAVLGVVYQLLTPKRLQKWMVESVHDNWGHQGVNRTLSLLRTRCYWPGIAGYVRDHVRNCFRCVASKPPIPTVRTPMRHLLAFRPMERVAIDFLKLDRGRGGFEDVLIMTDAFTKYALAVPCKDQTAPVVAKALRDHWISHYGIPLQLHSDQGRNFEGKLVGEICKLYGVQKTRTSPYHPEGNGQTERFNKTLCSLIKSLEVSERKRWPELLPHIVYMYNATPHSVTGVAPWTLLFGQQPMIPVDHLVGNSQQDLGDDYVQEQAKFLKQAYDVVKDRLIKAADQNKKYVDAKCKPAQSLEVGSRVLVKNCAFKGRHKLSDHFSQERYVVTECNEEQDLFAVRPTLGGKEKWVNRRLLILDPRDEVEPHKFLPELNGSDGSDSLSSPDDLDSRELGFGSDSSSSDDEVLVCAPSKTVAPSEPSPQNRSKCPGGSTAPVVEPRRSERLRLKRRLDNWPSAIT